LIDQTEIANPPLYPRLSNPQRSKPLGAAVGRVGVYAPTLYASKPSFSIQLTAAERPARCNMGPASTNDHGPPHAHHRIRGFQQPVAARQPINAASASPDRLERQIAYEVKARHTSP